MLPLLTIALPGLIKLAEGLFSKGSDGSSDPAVSSGTMKHAFVMKSLDFLYDSTVSKVMHDFQDIDEKRLFMRTCEVWIDELVPALTK